MRKLVKWLSSKLDDLVAAICIVILCSSVALSAERFDFAEHTYEFIDGDKTIVECHEDDELAAKHWIIIFADGCTVEFVTDLDDTDSRCWRWTHRRVHGKKA